jgi:hypothetical protein
MEVVIVCHSGTDDIGAFAEVTVIVLVIAQDHDHLGKKVLTPVQECLAQHTAWTLGFYISGHQDITTEYEHIHIVTIFKIQIPKLQMEIAGHIQFHAYFTVIT